MEAPCKSCKRPGDGLGQSEAPATEHLQYPWWAKLESEQPCATKLDYFTSTRIMCPKKIEAPCGTSGSWLNGSCGSSLCKWNVCSSGPLLAGRTRSKCSTHLCIQASTGVSMERLRAACLHSLTKTLLADMLSLRAVTHA